MLKILAKTFSLLYGKSLDRNPRVLIRRMMTLTIQTSTKNSGVSVVYDAQFSLTYLAVCDRLPNLLKLFFQPHSTSKVPSGHDGPRDIQASMSTGPRLNRQL